MYCRRCGAENEEDADFCSKCGTPLKEGGSIPASMRRGEAECFGGPGGAIPSLVIGAIIIFVGLASVFGSGFGMMMGAWGESIGRWGEGVGRFFADWGMGIGRFFAEWGMSWGSTVGAFIAILVGLAIVLSILNRGDRW